jgi:taurine--2-oxoglutarate transaminase
MSSRTLDEEMKDLAVESQSAVGPGDVSRWEREHVLHPWRTQGADLPVAVRARGTRFWDAAGNEFLDFTSQLVYANLGHSEPELAQAAARQMELLPAMASMFATEPKAVLARLLSEISPGDLNRSFFSTTGTESVEAALKIARLATGRTTVITRYRSYHGSTMGSASLTRDPRLWGTQPDPGGTVAALDPYCYRCPFGLKYPSCELRCANHIEDLIQLNGGSDHVAAVIVEPITGANGVIVPPDGYMQRLREICTRHGVLLIADEVMVGFGRTGRWFACDHWDVVPDIMTVGKGLTNGAIPLAATLVREDLARVFESLPFLHGHTYSGNTTGCAVAVRAIEIYRERSLIERSRSLGEYLYDQAKWLQQRHPSIGDVRGLGLFVGLELVRNRATREPISPWPQKFPVAETPLAGVLAACRKSGLFLMMAHPSVLHMAPPLTIERTEIDEAITILDEALLITDSLVVQGGAVA